MKEKLEEGIPGHTILVRTENIKWIRKGKEIYINGHYFDIRSSKTIDAYTEFEGIYDDEETALNKELNGAWSEQSGKNNHLIASSIFLLHLFQEKQNIDFQVTVSKISRKPYCIYNLVTSYQEIPTPPPQLNS